MPTNAGDGHFSEYAIVVDANILLAQPEIETIDWGVSPVTVFILDSVLHDELEGLRRHHNSNVANRARQAYERLDTLQKRYNDGDVDTPGGKLRFAPIPEQIPDPLEPGDVDQQQIAFAYNWMQEAPDRFCAIVTRDRAMRDIAVSARPPVYVITPGSGNLEWEAREQLARLLRWSAVWPRPSTPAPAVTQPQEPPTGPNRFDESAHNLFRRIQSANYRTMLAVPPHAMRMAVGARIVQEQVADRSTVVFLHVPDRRAAEQWEAVLHRQCNLPAGSIAVFGNEEGVPVGPTRVLIFRHDQIERRLSQYIARFRKQGRQVIAIVDSCELVNPVGIAMLLFECPRFIGFTQHPFDHEQATGGRMLSAFFRQQTVASYTFADAEADGWVHPFDFMRRPVSLAADPQYDEINGKFVAIRNQVRQRYPALANTNDFWQGLHDLLDHAVDQHAASLFQLREEREEIAQLAPGKLEVAHRLLDHSGAPARSLIFDYEGVWGHVLKKRFTTANRSVNIIEKNASEEIWNSVWHEFEQARLDCLILQQPPPPHLSQTFIRRLILMTPLTPLTLLSEITDWVLSHAADGPPVAIDLLYAADTPEQQAMIDFADACFGLRFR